MANPTSQAIADRCGVSRPCVSQILNGKGQRFSSELCRRVERVARELGYRPNGAARAVARGRFEALALIQPSDSPGFWGTAGLPPALVAAAREQGWRVLLDQMPLRDLGDPERQPQILRELAVDALVVNAPEDAAERWQAALGSLDLPLVWFNRVADHDAVRPDDRQGGRAMTEHLLALGHRRVAWVDLVASGHSSHGERAAGYAAAMAAAGLPARACTPALADRRPVDGRSALAALLAPSPQRPTAVATYSITEAIQVALAAAAAGLELGRDLSLVTCAEAPFDRLPIPVATWCIPVTAMARAAVSMLVDAVDVPRPSQVVPGHLVPAASARPLRT